MDGHSTQEDLAAVERELAALHKTRDGIDEQLVTLAERRNQLLDTMNRAFVAGRSPQDVWSASDARTRIGELAEREWANGVGSSFLNAYLREAFTSLDGGVCGFQRSVGPDQVVVSLSPQLYLTQGQDVAALVVALGRVFSILAVDGAMRVDILGDSYDTVELVVTGSDAAVLRSRSDIRAQGTLGEVLRVVADRHYGLRAP